jgi:hypothetical protein
MPKHYYLSQFIGSGTELDPFKPLTAKFGPSSILDLRPDETQPKGWCFACVDRDVQIGVKSESGLIYLGQDGHVNLSESTINQLKRCLRIDFQSQTLAEIAAEILLLGRIPGRGLRPDLDGKYRLHLGGLLWEVTEPEAYEFVGSLRETELLGPAPTLPSQMSDRRPALGDALATIANIVDYGRRGWLDSEMAKVKTKQSNHSLATNYLEASNLLKDSDFMRIYESPAAIRILMLASDLRITSQQVDVKRVSSRLRDPSDCEPTKYELYVMASYLQAGARVEKTDTDSTGEFRIIEDGQHVHVECKYKDLNRIGQRRVKAVFDSANERLRELMEQKDVKALVQISCRTDPIEEDLSALMACISDELEKDIGEVGLQFKCGGKFEVRVLPSSRITADSGVMLPVGFDYGFTEASLEKGSSGELGPRRGWGIVWSVLRPGGWMRSVVDSVRQASSQVPAESPNLIYVHVPAGSLGAVTTRIDSVVPEIEDLLCNQHRYTRVNAVILTGQAVLRRGSAPNAATVRFIYRTVANRNPRNTLSSHFRIFGRDFTRNRRDW